MPDASDPDTPNAPPEPDGGDRDWFVQQWNALCAELGTTDPNEVLARVQTLKRQMEQVDDADGDAAAPDAEGLVTISEVEEVFREMNAKIDELRQRNAALVRRLEGDDDADEPLHAAYQQTEQLLDTLGAATMDEAHERIEELHERLEELYRLRATLGEAQADDAEAVVEELRALRAEREKLREERNQLREERDRLREERDRLEREAASTAADPSALEAAIRDEIGVSSPEQARALATVVEGLHGKVRARAAAHDLAAESPPTGVVGRLRRMSEYLDALPAPDALPPDAAERLGVHSTSEAPALVDAARAVVRRVAARHDEALAPAAVEDEADDALSLLQALADRLEALPAPTGDAPDEALPAEAGDILGIRTVDDARELEGLIDDLTDQLNRLRAEQATLDDADLSAEGALTMIENLEAQLVDLYHRSGPPGDGHPSPPAEPDPDALDPSLRGRIAALVDLPEPPDSPRALVEPLVDRLETLTAEHETLAEADLDAQEAVTLIESLEAQLDDLYRAEEAETDSSDAAERLAAIDDVLGISGREDAEELAAIARQMEAQLTSLYEEKEKLQALGVSSIEDAVDMIESMEQQLDELYEDKQALRSIEASDTEQQSTFQQLEALYAERQKLQEALGVSSADEVIEMIESLNSQLDDLYTGRDAELDPEERHDAQLWSPEAGAPDEAPPEDAPEEASPPPVDALTLNSMEHQLETLYREKETLLQHGFGSAEEAVGRLETQERQIDILQRENHSYERRLKQLEAELGTDDIPSLVKRVRALESAADTRLDALDPGAAATDASTDYSVHLEAAAPLVSPDTLDRLDALSEEELEALEVGALRLDDDGVVETFNEAARQLPGLGSAAPEDIEGHNFFRDLAPSTDNNLFRGRVKRGRRRGELDARFPYTITGPNQNSASFEVHLYRSAGSDGTWLLFRPL